MKVQTLKPLFQYAFLSLALLPGLVPDRAMAKDLCSPDKAAEVAVVPEYCQYYFKHKSYKFPPPWDRILENVTGMSHFCKGLICVNRARRERKSDRLRREWLEYGLQNIDYTISHTRHNVTFRSVMLTEKARALFLKNDVQGALHAIKGALKTDPRNIQTYVLLYNHYKRKRSYDKALYVLTKGLEALPGSQPLLRRKAAVEKLMTAQAKKKESTEKDAKKSAP